LSSSLIFHIYRKNMATQAQAIPGRSGSTGANSRSVVASPPTELLSPARTLGFHPISPPKTLREEKVKLLKQLSGPTIKVLLLEGINQTGIELFERQGYEIETYAKALSPEDLKKKIKDVNVIGIRSKTNLAKAILEEAKNLVAIGCFCIGTNQVDLDYAEERGIPVFNSPFSNSRSVAELVMGELIALSRHVGDQNKLLHNGNFQKPPVQQCYEIRGKTLGIIGYGHIGTQLGVLADAMGMRVIFYDIILIMPLGTARSVSTLEELLAESDFVPLHVPATSQTENMIGEEQLKLMKKGSYLINNSRGSVVDVKAFAEYLRNGHLGGGAVDVYPKEPESNGAGFESALIGCPNLLMTPHIGGSTEEAQRAIGVEVASSLIRYLKNGSSIGTVNFPIIELKNPKADSQIVRILNVHENVPGVLKQINKTISVFNILKQVCESREKIAYMVADVFIQSQEDIKVLEELQAQLSKLPENISTRILY
jgi:D-3-phosphoglycerate dehydrogenase